MSDKSIFDRKVLGVGAVIALWCTLLAMPVISLADDLPLQIIPTAGKPSLNPPSSISASTILGYAPDPTGDPIANEVVVCNGCFSLPQAGVVFWQQCPVGGSPLCSTSWFINGPCDSYVNSGPSLKAQCGQVDKTVGSQYLPQIPAPTITVDGALLSQDAYRAKVRSIALASDPTTDSHLVLKEAAALLVLDHLLYAEAAQNGLSATSADGRAIALRMLDIYKTHHVNDPAVPKSNPEGFFLSPARIAGYQYGETVRRERDRVLAGIDRSDSAAVRTAFANWMRLVLQHHGVVVSGTVISTTLSLPDLLPTKL